MKIFLSGLPRSGKSTVLMRVIDILKEKGLRVGGFITPEIQVEGKRTGFKVVDIYSREEGILASIEQKFGPKVSKYRINIPDFERIALKALDFAMKECDVCAIDELGTMELFSQKFKENVNMILKTDKPVVIALHRNLIKDYQKYGKVIWVDSRNREKLPEEIVNLLYGSSQN
jgi:nucleoside-triphosphatase